MAPILSQFTLWTTGLLALTATAQTIVQDPKTACEAFGKTFKHENVTVNFAQHVPASTNLTFSSAGVLQTCTPFSQVAPVDICRVAMHVSTSNRSGITMEAWLPSNWTGRFMATGNGGLNGCIKYTDIAYGTSFGFAAVGANNGHNGTRGLAFANNSEVVTDFAWRSLYTETIVGKAVVNAYYEKSIAHSYYVGCSTGGRQGFKMVQDFPELFEGVLVGAPAIAFSNLTSWSGHFLPITGTNTSENYLPPSKWTIVHEDILRQCDGLDGVEDGILEDPSLCQYKPVGLLCASNAQNTSNCLTAPQVQTVSKIFTDWYGTDGALIYPRMQPGSELASANIEYNGQPFPYTEDWFRYVVLNDPTWDAATLNITYASIAASLNPGGIQTWKGDLSAFQKRGGKILHYHGEMDQIISSFNSPRYYDHVATTMALAPSDLDSFYRFFRIAGMGHCSGGLGAWSIGQEDIGDERDAQHNVVQRMIEWVEGGDSKAPETLTGLKYVDDDASKGVELERKHCKYPLRNVCKDKSRYQEADAWECVP